MELHVLNQPFPRPQALRVRHPRQLVLPLLPPTVRRPTVARPRRDEVQLGLPLGRQHALPLRSECPPFLLSSLAVPSFQFSFSARSFPPRRLLGMEAGNRQAQARSRLPRIASILVRVQRSLLLTLHSGRPVHAIRLRDLYVSFAFSSSSFPVLKGGRTEPPPKPPLLPSFANSEPPRARPADLGYNALPFLIRSELLLFPVAIFAAFYIVSLLGFNISHVVLEGLFGR